MSRNRAWRRHMEERVVIKRLRRKCHREYWWKFDDVNKVGKHHPKIIDFLNTQDYFRAKTITTSKWDTRYKTKYSPNSINSYYRDSKNHKDSVGLREKDKRNFYKLLRENGIK